MKVEVPYPLPWLPVYQLKGSKWWVVLDDHLFELRLDGVDYKIIVPGGYRYDRATIWWEGVISKDSLGCQGALIHDVICKFHGMIPNVEYHPDSIDTPHISPWRRFTRPEADDIFYAVMLADGISQWRAWTARQFVRAARNWRW